MDRRLIDTFELKFKSAILLCALLFALRGSAEAQQPQKIPRVAFLNGSMPSAMADRIEAFRKGLRELGYVEGKNIVIESRFAEGNRDRERTLAAELARSKVDVIVTGGGSSTRAAKDATNTIPIVMTQVGDPVGDRFVTSIARPGGNVTGLSTLSPELSGKRLEILKEVIPALSRVALFGTSTQAGNAQQLKEIELAAEAIGVKLQYLNVLSPKDIETAFRAATKGRAEAVFMMVSGPILNPHRAQIVDLAVKSLLPVMYESESNLRAGGLMSYGVNLNDLARRAATYVAKILKGRKPADLPVEQPRKFEFIINLKAAKQIARRFRRTYWQGQTR
jgi:putative ABC transport system substrate-binding protein